MRNGHRWLVAASLLLHPFGIWTSGRCAVAEQGSDAYMASQIAVVVGTRLGERPMCSSYGVADGAFGGFVGAEIQTCLDRYGPDSVKIISVVTVMTQDNVETASIEWNHA